MNGDAGLTKPVSAIPMAPLGLRMIATELSSTALPGHPSELGRDRLGHGAEEEPGQVQRVASQVDQRATAGFLGLEEAGRQPAPTDGAVVRQPDRGPAVTSPSRPVPRISRMASVYPCDSRGSETTSLTARRSDGVDDLARLGRRQRQRPSR